MAGERRLLGRVLLRAELARSRLEPGGAPEALGGDPGPGVTLLHYTVGVGLELTDPVLSRWDISVAAGAGGTHLDAGGSPAVPDHAGHRGTTRLSGRVGYDFTRSVTLYLRADAYLIAADEEAPAALADGTALLTHAMELRIGL